MKRYIYEKQVSMEEFNAAYRQRRRSSCGLKRKKNEPFYRGDYTYRNNEDGSSNYYNLITVYDENTKPEGYDFAYIEEVVDNKWVKVEK